MTDKKTPEIRPESLYDFSFYSGLCFSSSSKYLAYKEIRADQKTDKYLDRIHVFDCENEKEIFVSDEGEHGCLFFEGDSSLYFTKVKTANDSAYSEKRADSTEGKSLRNAKNLIYRIDIEVLNIDFCFEIESASINSAAVFDKSFIFSIESDSDTYECGSGAVKKNLFAETVSIPVLENGREIWGSVKSDLLLYSPENKKIKYMSQLFLKKKLSRREGNFELLDISAETGKLLFTFEENSEKKNLFNRLFVFELTASKFREVKLRSPAIFGGGGFLDGKIYFFASSAEKFGINEFPSLFTADENDLKPAGISEGPCFGDYICADMNPCSGREYCGFGKEIYFIRTCENKSIIQKSGLSGKLLDVFNEDGAVLSLAVKGRSENQNDVKIALARQGVLGLPELLLIKNKKIISISKNVSSNYQACKMAKPTCCERVESFSFRSQGEELRGFVMMPVNKRLSKEGKTPAVLFIHGGPCMTYSPIFLHEFEVFLSAGYCIYFTNPHGSAGRSREFADIRGRWGDTDYLQLMKLTDELCRLFPEIDSERLGITGGSYGGYMTNLIIGRSKRFKAASSQRSISSLITMFGLSDIGYYFIKDQTGADPWNAEEKLKQASPLSYASAIKTPLLLIHSENDYRCNVSEAIQLFTAIKYFGGDAKLLIFKGENHDLSRSGSPEKRVIRLRKMLEWFEKHL